MDAYLLAPDLQYSSPPASERPPARKGQDEGSWYNAFVPGRSSKRNARRQSLLEPSNINADEADVDAVELADPVAAPFPRPLSPPQASVVRRAKSQSDVRRDGGRRKRRRRRFSIDAKGRQECKHEEDRIVKTQLDFESWYGKTSDALVDSSHEKYQLYEDQLRLSRQHLDSLLEDTTLDLNLLSDLSTSFAAVELQTSLFYSRCEGLLSEQKRLTGLAEGMADSLQYYSLLDPLTRRLDAPGARHLVRGGDFPQTLANLDRCLDFMQAHPQHSEAAVYQSRYRLLLTRALTLIRQHFTNSLREIAADVSKRIADKQLNDTTMTTLLYAKFRVGAPELKALGLEIQKRAIPPLGSEPGTQGEYQSLMNELYQSYAAARGRLLIPLIRKKLAEMNEAPSMAKDLVAFARGSIGYIRGICLDEYDLWREWFEGDGGLYDFLEAMSEPLYDYLRPRTVRETQLPKLCEMCSLLQVRYMDEQEDEYGAQQVMKLDFAELIRPALEDTQTRLVFVALSVLREEIERFRPKPADLDNAGKVARVPMSGTRTKAPQLPRNKSGGEPTLSPTPKTPLIVEEEGTDPMDMNWRYDSGAPVQEWFPTLRKAIWLLSRIYRLVNSTVFDDLAHQIVHQTTLSLSRASTVIPTKPPKANPTDPNLFLLKQLLILKQQIIAFDIEYVSAQGDVNFDFSSVLSTFWDLRERGALEVLRPGNLLKLVGGALIPRVVENMLDAKAELDIRLRDVIHDLVNVFAARMTTAIASSASPTKKATTPIQPHKFGDPAAAASAVRTTRSAIETEVPILRARLDEYLDDARVKDTLVAAVEDQVLQTYEDFFEAYRLNRKNAGVVATVEFSRKGKGREDDVWDPDTFADWTGGVFGVVGINDGFGGGFDDDRD